MLLVQSTPKVVYFPVSAVVANVVLGKGNAGGFNFNGTYDLNGFTNNTQLVCRVDLSATDTNTIGPLDVLAMDGAGNCVGSWHGVVLVNYPSTGDPLASLVPGAYAAGSAGQILGDNLDATVSSRLATGGYSAPDNTGIASAVAIATNIDAGLTAGSYFIQLTVGDFDALVAAIWQTANQIDGQYSYQEAVRVMLAALAGLVSISGNVVTIRDTADTKNRIAATTDAAGQRLLVVLNAT